MFSLPSPDAQGCPAPASLVADTPTITVNGSSSTCTASGPLWVCPLRTNYTYPAPLAVLVTFTPKVAAAGAQSGLNLTLSGKDFTQGW